MYTFITSHDSPNYTPGNEAVSVWGRPRTIEKIAIHTPFQITTRDNSWILVDKEDIRLLDKKWSFSNGYAKRYHEKNIDGRRVRWVEYLHRVIMGAKDGEVVDHINGDTSDNRRSNLRIANKVLNSLNTNKHKGVYYSSKNNRWYARITINGKTKSLGGHDTVGAAIETYKQAKKEALCTLS